MFRALSALFLMSQYYFNGTLVNWSDAYLQCQNTGGQLVVINSAAEAAVVKQLMVKYNTSSIHVGFHDKFVEGHYTTIHGDPIDASSAGQWALGFPRGGVAYNCGGLMDGGLFDVDCATKQQSICELRQWHGYELLEGLGYYKHHRVDATWPHAWHTCRSESAHLVVLNSQAELDALYRRYAVGAFWVGVHQLHADNTFVTVFDQPIAKAGYNNWYSAWPWPRNDNTSRPYVAVHGNRGLLTHDPSVEYEFICEHELV